MAPSMFPSINGMSSFWRSQEAELDTYRSTSELPSQCDIVVVGAGYAGAAAVTQILSKSGDKTPSILVLEARQLCSGATGRNGKSLPADSQPVNF
jgi:ribulose 1,5-bisphosphate synthetase/thiazole synthase